MKLKLQKPQDAFKILEQSYGYKIPKEWYQVEFPKTKKRKKKVDTVWKDYTIVLFAKKWIYVCGNKIANKIRMLVESKDLLYDTITSGRLLKSLVEGFGIKKIGGKLYLQNEFDERIERIEDYVPLNIPLNIKRNMPLDAEAYGIDKEKIKPVKKHIAVKTS